MHIMILGSTGLLGSTLLRFFARKPYQISSVSRYIPSSYNRENFHAVNFQLIDDVTSLEELSSLIQSNGPDIVINCVGIIKQNSHMVNPLVAISVNSLFPHQLMNICTNVGARLIHISTDCIFSGNTGMYDEYSIPDAEDLYGRSKLLGEIDYGNSITLRTSIIGHELNSSASLINWFLSQSHAIEGYTKAFFSGLPTVELARIINDYVITNPQLRGIYHVSAEPINKFDLLSLVASEYKKSIEIKPNSSFVIDRTLDSSRFRRATGYIPKSWPTMIYEMHNFL